MGTSNFGQILTDPTGNSRFCTIDVQSFDLKRYFTVDLDKLWRAVYDLHLSGETSNLTERERAMQTAENQNFEAVDAYSELIEQSFEKSVTGFITATEVMQELEKNTKQHISINKVGAALKKLGFEKGPKRINGTVRKGYNLKYIFFDTE
jgi:predicted P-loop ATPase